MTARLPKRKGTCQDLQFQSLFSEETILVIDERVLWTYGPTQEAAE